MALQRRPERIGSVLLRELSQFILREIEFPLNTLVTVTGVEVSEDLEKATVKFSAIPSEKAKEVLDVLITAKRKIQHFLLKTMRMRRPPAITFYIDRGPEEAAKVEKLLQE